MLGATLNKLLEQKNMKVADLSALSGVPIQTIYSIKKRDSLKVDFGTIVRLCRSLGVPLEVFAEEASPGGGFGAVVNAEEWELVRQYRMIDMYGKKLVGQVIQAEAERTAEQGKREPNRSMKPIPLYRTPAAAGYASPAFGDECDAYFVNADSPADFAFRVDGRSMEPLIEDGSVQLVCRDQTVKEGDVGLFFVDGDMKCKQYHRESDGTVWLRSLNRDCADSDVCIDENAGITLKCFGKVLL